MTDHWCLARQCSTAAESGYNAGMTPAERRIEQIRRLAWIAQQISKAKSMSEDPLISD